MQEGRTGEGWEILYDHIVKHGFIICREIKAPQKLFMQKQIQMYYRYVQAINTVIRI